MASDQTKDHDTRHSTYMIPLAFLFACNSAKDTGCTTETFSWVPAGEDASSFTLEVSDDWSVERARCVDSSGNEDAYTAEPCENLQILETEDVTGLFERSEAGELCLTPELCDLGIATTNWEFYSVTTSWQICGDATSAE